MSRIQFGVVTGLLVAIALIAVAPIVAPNRTAPTWEYFVEGIEDSKFLSEMNAFGQVGWELVFARRAIGGSEGDKKSSYEVIFKRPR